MLASLYDTDVPLSSSVYPLNNTPLENAPGFGFYDIFGKGEASVGTLKVTIHKNEVLVCEDITLLAEAGQPTKDHHIVGFPVVVGEKIRIKLTETAGTASIPQLKTVFTPHGEQRPIAG